MSRNMFINFRGRDIGVYDVAFSVLAKHLVDAALAHPSIAEPWLAEAARRWGVEAVITDCGMHLDDDWSPRQVAIVIELLGHACDALSSREEIPREEIESWSFDHEAGPLRVETRGEDVMETARVITLGRAIADLLRGTLAETPPNHTCFFGFQESPFLWKHRS
jgi:hypothetical protein